MVRSVRVLVRAKCSDCSTLRRLPRIHPVPAMRVGGSGTSNETEGCQDNADVSMNHSQWAPDWRSKYSIGSCGVLGPGCSPMRLVRVRMFRGDLVRYVS